MQQLSTCIAVDFLTRPIIPNWRFQHGGSAGEKRGAVARNDSRWLMVPTFRKPPAFPETKKHMQVQHAFKCMFPKFEELITKKDTNTCDMSAGAMPSALQNAQAATLNPSAGL